MLKQPLKMLLLLACLGGLAACDDKKDDKKPAPPAAAAPQAPAKPVVDTQAQMTQKYNAYVDAANAESAVSDRSLAEAYDAWQQKIQPELQQPGIPQNFRVVEPDGLVFIQQQLNRAMAIDAPMPALDSAAEDYDNSLSRLLSLAAMLDGYRHSPVFSADKGAKARASSADYDSAFTEVLQRQDVFTKALVDQDNQQIKVAFDNSAQDDPVHYRYGVAYYARQAMDSLMALRANPSDAAKEQVFNEANSQLKQLAASWRVLHKNKQVTTCDGVVDASQRFTEVMQQQGEEALKGNWRSAEGDQDSLYQPRDAAVDGFNQLIQTMNMIQGC